MANTDPRFLTPRLQGAVVALLNFVNDGGCGEGITAVIGRTLCTPEEQGALYAKGRTRPGVYTHRQQIGSTCMKCAPGGMGHPVTKAPPGSTYHEYGRAVDFVLLEHGKITKATDETSDPAWQRFGRKVDELGLCWGGHWPSIPDGGHVEDHPAGLGCSDALRLKPPDVA